MGKGGGGRVGVNLISSGELDATCFLGWFWGTPATEIFQT